MSESRTSEYDFGDFAVRFTHHENAGEIVSHAALTVTNVTESFDGVARFNKVLWSKTNKSRAGWDSYNVPLVESHLLRDAATFLSGCAIKILERSAQQDRLAKKWD